MIFTASPGAVLPLGYMGENVVEAIVFDRSCWVSQYGPGAFELVHRRRQDTEALPVAIDVSGGVVTWTLTDADTAYRGRGECQLLFYTPDGRLKKSEVYETQTARSLTSSENVPEPMQGWVEQVTQTAAAAENAKQAAQSAQQGAETARDAAQSAAASAAQSEENAAASAGTAAAQAGNAADSASDAWQAAAAALANARAAAQSALSMAFAAFDIRPDGHLVIRRAERLGTTSFALSAAGHLEVIL